MADVRRFVHLLDQAHRHAAATRGTRSMPTARAARPSTTALRQTEAATRHAHTRAQARALVRAVLAIR